jgi:hypothetical protein
MPEKQESFFICETGFDAMRSLWLVFLLGLFCRDALAQSDVELVEMVRAAIIEQLLDGNSAGMKHEIPEDTKFIREIAPRNLGINIVSSAAEVAGTNFRFETSHRLTHVGVWVFSYHTHVTALRIAESVRGFCKDGCYFKSKILTPFSYAVAGSKVIIIFTENAGNESAVAFVKSAPTLFADDAHDNEVLQKDD